MSAMAAILKIYFSAHLHICSGYVTQVSVGLLFLGFFLFFFLFCFVFFVLFFVVVFCWVFLTLPLVSVSCSDSGFLV